jgi:hypothetical protein
LPECSQQVLDRPFAHPRHAVEFVRAFAPSERCGEKPNRCTTIGTKQIGPGDGKPAAATIDSHGQIRIGDTARSAGSSRAGSGFFDLDG